MRLSGENKQIHLQNTNFETSMRLLFEKFCCERVVEKEGSSWQRCGTHRGNAEKQNLLNSPNDKNYLEFLSNIQVPVHFPRDSVSGLIKTWTVSYKFCI